MYPSPFTYHRPTSIDEALTLFAQYDDAAFLAGVLAGDLAPLVLVMRRAGSL